ncbi:MAG: glycosyltransferase family 4 protein [Gammaproteobacteria bacterium]|nr:glycosyltransferase family 4 protein [Gammaproteobacteria bacterium]MBU1481673.1 glycosyltransferase family 4 protein [Gammaproteobacteria bacterium]
MDSTAYPDKEEVTLIAHASAYGGVATHLNQFATVLRGMVSVKHVFLFTNSAIEINSENGLPAPTLVPTLNSLWASRRLLLKLLVPLNLVREIWLAARYCGAICGRHIVITSHDPHAFWGLVLLAGHAEYFLFVLPDPREDDSTRKPRKLRDAVYRIWQAFMHRVVSRRLERASLSLVAPTSYAAEMWAELLKIDSAAIRVIPNPPFLARQCNGILRDVQANSSMIDTIIQLAKEGLKLVLSVGHMVDYKNPHKWLELTKHAHEKNAGLLFVWAGDGPLLEEIRTSAAGYSRIFLPGRLNQSDLRRLYEICWVFFHPAIKESQGIVVMDALTLGIPVILNESEALPGLIGDSGAGCVIDCASDDASSRYISILDGLGDGEGYQHASRQARLLASRSYSYEKWLAELRTLLLKTQELCERI